MRLQPKNIFNRPRLLTGVARTEKLGSSHASTSKLQEDIDSFSTDVLAEFNQKKGVGQHSTVYIENKLLTLL